MRAALWQRPWLRRLFIGAVMLLIIAAFLFLSTTLSTAEFKEGRGLGELLDTLAGVLAGPRGGALSAIPTLYWTIFAAVIWGTLILAILFLLRSTDGRRQFRSVLGRTLIRGALLTAIVLFFIATVPRNSQSEYVEVEESPTTISPELDDLAPQTDLPDIDLPEPASSTPFLILYILFFLGLVTYIGWQFWQYRQAEKEMGQAVDAVRDRALSALKALDRDQAPLADIIRRCYQEMTQTVREQQGVRRSRNTTAREFEETLASIGLPPEPVQRLTRLFERVRYGHASVGEPEKQAAVESLEAIVSACEQLSREQQARRAVYIAADSQPPS